MAQIVPWNNQTLQRCIEELKQDRLVAFPTETVYGLGAHALSSTAVEKIFIAKKRPKSDPIIVHIAEIKQSYALTEMSPFQKTCFEILGQKFWPGPLTLIVPASKAVPQIVTSHSPYVGIRIPSHPVALELLAQSKLPIAAPSANTFGHVSPTSARHVYDDLHEVDPLIIIETHIPCQVGIESTILKIVDENEITLLRPGSISSLEIEAVLKDNNISAQVILKRREIKEENSQEIESSGQLLTHYSPMIESFILKDNYDLEDKKEFISRAILIDFANKNIKNAGSFLAYFDLSVSGNYAEASKNLFSILRQAERMKEASYILLPDFSNQQEPLGQAIFDRIYRAASGKFI